MSFTSPTRPRGTSLASASYVAGACIGVLVVPGATALTRTPLLATSIASDFVSAFTPPLVSAARPAGLEATGRSTSAALMLTMCPLRCESELRENDLRDVKEPGDVRPGHRVEVLLRVLEERLADEQAGVVDERVDTPEALLRGGDDLLRRRALPDVAGDRQHLVVLRWRDRFATWRRRGNLVRGSQRPARLRCPGMRR